MKKYIVGGTLVTFIVLCIVLIWKLAAFVFGGASQTAPAAPGRVAETRAYDKPIGMPKEEHMGDSGPRSVTSCPSGMVSVQDKFCIDIYEYPNAKGELPKSKVSWDEASDLCSAQGKRLCIGEEWTVACKGPEANTYSYGRTPDPSACNIAYPGNFKTSPAGSYEKCRNGYGIYDMVGNVWEWTGHDRSASSTRGCGWDCDAMSATCNAKLSSLPNSKMLTFGFRCCK
jgi:hypothetical protein